jgi:hypothetical protein
VFEEVSETGFSNLLAGRTDMVGDIDMSNGIRVILVDNESEAIGEDVFRVGNDDLACGGLDSFDQASLGAQCGKLRRLGEAAQG